MGSMDDKYLKSSLANPFDLKLVLLKQIWTISDRSTFFIEAILIFGLHLDHAFQVRIHFDLALELYWWIS